MRCKFCEAPTGHSRKDFCCPGHKVAFSMKQYDLKKHPTKETLMHKLIYRAHDVAATKVRVWREDWPGDTFEIFGREGFIQTFLINRDQTTLLGAWSEIAQAEDDDIMIPGTEPNTIEASTREERSITRSRFFIGTFRLRVDHAPEGDSEEAIIEDLANMLTDEAFELDTDRGITATILDIRLGVDPKAASEESGEEESLELPDEDETENGPDISPVETY